MAKLLIATLAEEQDVDSFFMVRGRQLRSFRGRSGSFLVLRLGDKSGEIEAKVWDEAEQWYGRLKVETIVRAAGRTQIYNGRLEMNLSRLRLAREDEYALEDFLPVSGRGRDEMLDELQVVVDSIANPHLSALLARVFEPQVLREFATAPAAKVIHHACLGGLLEHTLEVVRFCRTAAEIYPKVDRDLLFTAALLHDIGKIREYIYQRSIDFTDEGKLLGHITLSDELVVSHVRQLPAFPEELLVRLRHMLLSHHGQYEWQSPKRPKTIEACILHLADYFSGQVALFDASIRATNDPDATWTDYNRYLDRAVFIGNALPSQPSSDEVETMRRLFEERYQSY